MKIIAFGKEYEVADKDWRWMTVDEDGTITIFVNDPNDEEFQGEPERFNSNWSGGYWSNPFGPKAGWLELEKKYKENEDKLTNWEQELYVLE